MSVFTWLFLRAFAPHYRRMYAENAELREMVKRLIVLLHQSQGRERQMIALMEAIGNDGMGDSGNYHSRDDRRGWMAGAEND